MKTEKLKEKQSKSLEAYSKLLEIVAKYNNGWFPKRSDLGFQPYVYFASGEWSVSYGWLSSSFSGFGLRFKNLEDCKKSVSEDLQLWKDYFMID